MTWDMAQWDMARIVGHGQRDLIDVRHGHKNGTWPGQWDMDRGTSMTWDMATTVGYGQDSGTWTKGPQ